jgi:anti-sigma regulatory factor (Ser/Thr protein kinase)
MDPLASGYQCGLIRIGVEAGMDSDDDLRTLAHRDITAESLPEIRTASTDLAAAAGLDPDRAERFAFAVHEVAANTVDHAESTGELTVVQDDDTVLYAQVLDHGPGMAIPTTSGRPAVDATRGRGLWLSQELIDRMHIDSDADGTVVHLEMTLDDPPDVDPDISEKNV